MTLRTHERKGQKESHVVNMVEAEPKGLLLGKRWHHIRSKEGLRKEINGSQNSKGQKVLLQKAPLGIPQ